MVLLQNDKDRRSNIMVDVGCVSMRCSKEETRRLSYLVPATSTGIGTRLAFRLSLVVIV
jgi:hypothetical protein